MMYSTREISLDAMRKLAGNKGRHMEGQHTETSGSAWERDWVVGLQILTTSLMMRNITSPLLLLYPFELTTHWYKLCLRLCAVGRIPTRSKVPTTRLEL